MPSPPIPTRGVFILAILVAFIGGGLALFAWRAPLLKQGGLFAPISREGALVLNNLFLTTACATVFVGTLYPLALEALTGDKISVGAPFFNVDLRAAVAAAAVAAMPFGPLMAWKRGDLFGVAQRLLGALAIALIAVPAIFAFAEPGPVLAPFAIGLALFVMAGALTDLVERTGLFRVPLAVALKRAAGLPRSTWGTAVAHFGIGLTLARHRVRDDVERGAHRHRQARPDPLDPPLRLHLRGLTTRQGPNYRELAASFTVRRNGEVLGTMEPSKRTFAARGTTTTEAALMTRGFSQLYLSLGDQNPDGSITVRLYHKPFVLLIWLGALVMVIGGALSLSDRRLRVGAPKPARPRATLQPAE